MLRHTSSFIIALFTFTSLLIVGTILVSPPPIANALEGSDFDAGRIIDDSIFYNTNSMSAAQIQAFLDSKLPVCDTNGTKMYTSTQTRAQWTASNGKPTPPYTCLKDYTQTIPAITNGGSDLCKNSVSAGTKSSAQLILDASNACGINPQVLLVMLQKEQSLITDDWPWPTQYDKAMGYACPDSGPNNSANCNSEYFGFFNQVYNAAKAFRRYEANPNSYNYKADRNNTILYNPNSACGTSNVFIENQATASLYIYTPYRPNQAALDNLYGSGDGCSAYGNRNFWRMFNDWFGSTWSDGYEVVSVQKPSGTIGINSSSLTVTVKNVSGTTWYADGHLPPGEHATRLTNKSYINSPFADQNYATWLGTQNQIRMVEPQVGHNEIATFTAAYTGGGVTGDTTHLHEYTVTVDGVKSYPYKNIFFTMSKVGSDYDYTMVSFNKPPATLKPGDSWTVRARLRNDGLQTWYSDGHPTNTGNKVRLMVAGYQNSPYAYTGDPAWLNTRNQIRLVEPSVAAGQIGTFEFKVFSPYRKEDFTHKFRLVLDGVSSIGGPVIDYRQKTYAPDFSYISLGATNPPSTMTAEQSASATVRIRNTGNTIWRNELSRVGDTNSMRLMMNNPNYRNSSFSDQSTQWLASKTQVRMTEYYVAPGQTGTFTIPWKAPSNAGSYSDPFTFVIDGVEIFNSRGMQFNTTVTD